MFNPTLPVDGTTGDVLFGQIFENDKLNRALNDAAVLITGLTRGKIVAWAATNSRWELYDGTVAPEATTMIGIVEYVGSPDTSGGVRVTGVYLDEALTSNTAYYCQSDGTLGTTETATFIGICTNAGRLVMQGRGSSGAGNPGDVIYTAKKTAPDGFLKANGAAISRTTYAALFDAICPAKEVTITIAYPAVFNCVGHGLSVGDPARLETTGALPTGLSVSTTCYVISAGFTADAFQLSTSVGGAALNASGTQSGVHKIRPFYFGVGDGSTTFNIPDLRGMFLRGWDDARGSDPNRVFGTLQTSVVGPHTHRLSGSGHDTGGSSRISFLGLSDALQTPSAQDISSGGGSETRPVNVSLLACIKF